MNRYRIPAILSLSFPALLLFLMAFIEIVKPGFGNGCATGSLSMLFYCMLWISGYIPGLFFAVVGIVLCSLGLKRGEPCKVWLVVSIIACVVNAAWALIFLGPLRY